MDNHNIEQKSTEKLLNALHQNLTMAVQSLDIIKQDTKDKDFLLEITKQNDEYEKFLDKINVISSMQ